MADDRAHVRMTADDREALAAWQRQVTAIDRLDRKIEALGRTGGFSGKQMESAFGNVAMRFFSLEQGATALLGSIMRIGESSDALQAMRAEAAIPASDAMTAFRVQAGMFDAGQSAEAEKQFNKIAIDLGTTSEWVKRAATQLVSSGFTTKDIMDGAARTMAEFAAATNSAQSDPEQMAKNFALFMSASKMPMSAESLRGLSIQVEQLYKATNLQTDALQFLAQESGAVTELGRISPQEQVTLFSQLMSSMGDRVGATAFRTMTSRLATAGGDDVRIEALKEVGLTPSDVDFVAGAGEAPEGIEVVFGRLQAAIEKLQPERRNIVISKLFGEEAMRAAVEFLRPEFLRRFAELKQMSADEPGFRRDVALATGGIGAQARRAEESQRQSRAKEEAAIMESFRKRFQTALEEREAAGEMSAAEVESIMQWFSQLKVWMKPETAAKVAEKMQMPKGPLDLFRQATAAEKAIRETPQMQLNVQERARLASVPGEQEKRRLDRIAELRAINPRGNAPEAAELFRLQREQRFAGVTDDSLRAAVANAQPLQNRVRLLLSREDEQRRQLGTESRAELIRRESERLPEGVLRNRILRAEPFEGSVQGLRTDEQNRFVQQSEAARLELRRREEVRVTVDNTEVAAAIRELKETQQALPGAIGQAVAAAVGKQPAGLPTPGRQPLRGLR